MFSKLKNLQTANLSHNPLLSVNTFSNVNYTLPKLYELYLSCCNFREFPSFLTNLENLEKLDLSHNQIKDNTPTWLFDVGKNSLRYLNQGSQYRTEGCIGLVSGTIYFGYWSIPVYCFRFTAIFLYL